MNTFLFYFLLFITYSFLGWMVESFFVLLMQKKISNRGFLIGPYCPIYGTAALLMHLFATNIKHDVIFLFIMTAIGVTILEYLTSLFMEQIYKARWWDYSDKKFNFQGRVCLSHTLLFGLLGIVFIYHINPFLIDTFNSINVPTINAISITILILFIFDNIISFNVMSKIKIKTDDLMKDYTDEINDKVKEFLLQHSFFTKRIAKAFPNLKLPSIKNIIKRKN